MRWQVASTRMPWPEGTVVDGAGLAGCNIDALVQGGHLAPAPTSKPGAPAKKTAREPEEL
jgi:hypothetical protein